MSNTIGIVVSASNQAAGTLNGIKNDLKGIQATAQSASAQMRAMGQSLTGTGTKLTAGLTLPLLGIAGAALKTAGDFEQTQIALTTMLGSADKANKLFADMQKFSAATPFEFPEIAQAGKQLLAFGISSDNVIPKLRQLGDIASGVGIPLSDLTVIYGQASVAGRVMTGDLNQLVGRGVPIISALAKTMGVAEGQVRTLAEQGKIGFSDFDKAISSLTENGGQFAGMMDAQSQSLLGLISTFKDNITNTLADVGKALVDAFDLKGKLSGLNEFLGGISSRIREFAQNNPEMFKFFAILAGIAAAVGPLAVGLGWVLTQMAGLGPIVSALAPAFALLTGPLGLVAVAIGALIYFDIGGLGSRLGELAGSFGSLWNYLKLVVEDGDYLNDFLADMPSWMQPAVEAVGHFIVALQSLPEYFRLVVEDGDYLNDFLADIPTWMQPAVEWIGRLIAGFSALVGGADFAQMKATVTAAFGDIWQAVNAFFSGGISLGGLASALSEGFDKIRGALAGFFGGGDFSKFLGTIQWSQFIEKLTWANVIAVLEWGAYIVALSWATVLPVLTSWGTYITSLPWGSYVATLSSWGTYIVALAWPTVIKTLDSWSEYITSLPWGSYVKTLADWGVYITALSWSAILPVLTSWGTYIANLDWTAIIVKIVDWATWIPALTWAAFVTLVAWNAYIAVLAWTSFIHALTWENFLVMMDWAVWMVKLDWKIFVKTVEWSSWLITLAWKDFVDKVSWLDYIAKLSAWGQFVPPLTWNSFVSKIDLASWIPDFGSWADYVWAYFQSGGAPTPPDHNATGTSYFRGGLTWVGETGPELVMAPRGSRIFSNNESMQMAGAGGGVTVNLYVTANTALDWEQAAYRVADIIQQRRR